MIKKMTIVIVALSLTTAVTALAGLFKIEVPADLDREDVLNPSAAAKARLDALTREVAAHSCAPLQDVEAEIDERVAHLYGITAAELKEVQKSLAELLA